MAEHEVVHVAIAPPATLEEELVMKVAAIMAKTSYETRLRLTGRIPKFIANYGNVQMAESIAQSLRELGLVVIVCTDSDLCQSAPIYRAHTVKLEEPAVLFWDKGGQVRRVEPGEVSLIISGRMQISTETEVITTVKKLNITATLMLGGIPVSKKTQTKTKSKTFQTESFVRLYGRTSPEPVVELLQQGLDYSFLGAEKGSSSMVNFSNTVKKIRSAFPEAIFDDRLVEPFGADIHSAIPEDEIEMNCKLIYWYYQALRGLGTAVQLQT
jgi:hypothetical protein